MRIGKLLTSAILAFVGLTGFGAANAAGYFSAVDKYTFDGWACNPSTPGYSGWIHIWRDDGKFLGALPAGNQRETAVGEICGDIGAHGFNGSISYPYEYLDNKSHTVRAYFINSDGSSFELQNSINVLFDGGAQPYIFNYQTSGACTVPSPFNDIPGYLLNNSPNYSYQWCGVTLGYRIPQTFVYVGDPAIPIGSEVEVCASPSTSAKLPSNWQVISVVNSNTCVKGFSSTTVGNNPPSFYGFTYYDRLKIRKVN